MYFDMVLCVFILLDNEYYQLPQKLSIIRCCLSVKTCVITDCREIS